MKVKKSEVKKEIMEDEPRKRPFVVSVEGNIGSGKSSMLKCFENMSEKVTTVPGKLLFCYFALVFLKRVNLLV